MKWEKVDHEFGMLLCYWNTNIGAIELVYGQHGSIIARVPAHGVFKLDGLDMQEALKNSLNLPNLEFDNDLERFR